MNSEQIGMQTHWIMCPECLGLGKRARKFSLKVQKRHQQGLEYFIKMNPGAPLPIQPQDILFPCPDCEASGVISSNAPPTENTDLYPHVSIIGGGIGGAALAVACFQRGIPFTLYERDTHFGARSQGYGLTLQQARRAIEALGIRSFEQGLVSTRHVVHNPEGQIVGEWGMRVWNHLSSRTSPKQTNIHITRQFLRESLLNQLGNLSPTWGHQLLDFKTLPNQKIELSFLVDGQVKTTQTDLVVGADGIRSVVRKKIIGDNKTPLRYLNCMVILGICPLSLLTEIQSDLLDSATVFQTANGHERIYIMPFTADSVMWQLSFPMDEEEAKNLSTQASYLKETSPEVLKNEAIRRTPWHSPIPQILKATPAQQVSGYPVYDRELLCSEFFEQAESVTLLGDAAHPMSPFKGQGANQALLDAVALARAITQGSTQNNNWKTKGLRQSVLKPFEAEMIERSKSKVLDSADAAQFLHTEVALYQANEPRGQCLKKAKKSEF